MRRAVLRDAVVVLVPALWFLALHLPALDYDLVWTDEPEIVHGSILRPAGRILHAFAEPLHATQDFAARPFSQPYYRPLQVVTASALAGSFGREPRVFRTVNLALGAATAALFTALAAALLRSRAAALLAGALWASHPVGLEIYVWVGGLAAALAGFAVVASLVCGALAWRSDSRASRIGFGALACAALALGLASKENAAVVPGLQLALALGLAADRSAGGSARDRLVASAALIGAQAAIVAGYLFALRPAVLGTAFTGAAPIGGRLPVQWLTSLAAWPELFAWLWLPIASTTSDAVRVVTTAADAGAALGAALLLGSAGVWLALLRRGHGNAAFALAWIWIAFLPTSGVTPLLHARAERNLFLSAFGAALLAACALRALRSRGVPRAAVVAIAVAAVVGLSERTLRRQPDWRSTAALFASDVARDPRHREGRLNLIAAHVKSGDLAAAKREVDVLVTQRFPDGWTSYALDASLLEAACLVNAAAGADADTLALVAADPPAGGIASMPGFHACFAFALERQGEHRRALAIHEKLHRLAPPRDGAGHALGAARCHAALGEPEQALAWLARIDPDAASPEVLRQARALGMRLAH
jgi:tetratricopeptide (TPR) repeat protein